jgi:cytochrome c-type biogenesis protein CcmH/NrfG
LPARVWFNLGIAYQGQAHYQKALEAYEQAAELPDAKEEMRKAAHEMKKYVNSRAKK